MRQQRSARFYHSNLAHSDHIEILAVLYCVEYVVNQKFRVIFNSIQGGQVFVS
ncbi:hypothetical protein ManeNPV_00063 [Malacosoma neustria nucleopolyhedrovirus]|uniref:hypothetical protein n=1 Tax=Malacosoma neustria nuclear polyhedrosis virus TaxID=38012 RepID=UPI000E35F0A2|nr:hypothetical protein ManeNPV_00063 [Malacosoma neustria nucleopolyhedrovirus]AUF81590.1 hypothetical protein ManeNPV_00063 [Malacosoma neustria nucleopolyhedrovirus]